ncbi:long-chain fatty acid--CoA ligase [Euryarchaeota archaeon]|nr:long-chain fatty acid--CoA ligase [Euryarchaeota archaeon]|tara:strand:+ start:1180 stop:2979 length:1800 start_codon:yes stop_codon:yes gene_type:complete
MSAMITPEYLLSNAEKYANEPALSSKDSAGNWDTTTWSEFSAYTMDVAKSLMSMGFESGDNLSIYSYNRKEWYAAYAAANMAGGAAVGVYHTCSPEEVDWVVGNSDSKVVFVGNNPMDGGDPSKMCSNRLNAVMDGLEKVEMAVIMDGVEMDHEKAISWSDFIAMGAKVEDSAVMERIAAVKPDDVASLIYTSGTTGNPKGVVLTHDNMDFEIGEVHKLVTFNQGEGYVSWLPCAHVFGQLADNHIWIRDAIHMRVVDNPLHSIDYCKEVNPHLFIGVPRIYEKVYSNLVAGLGSRVGWLKLPILGNIVRKKAKAKIGFTNLKFAITGAAPINPDILHLFHDLGIPIYEGYGMTETSAGATLGYAGANRIGSVGKPLSGTELRIADPDEGGNGEIQFRGRHVMAGYYRNPEATAETMTEDGWLKSGDLGKIDSDGFVYVTGRLKEIYVSSAGKNIAPLVIEETMKSIPVISQCMLIGDNRKYCSALFTLDVGAILRDVHGLDGATEVPKDPSEQLAKLAELGHDLSEYTAVGSDIHNQLEASVAGLNQKFSNPEQIKKFTVLPRDLGVDQGELTPTLKIRRKQIRENWAAEIEAMYSDA